MAVSPVTICMEVSPVAVPADLKSTCKVFPLCGLRNSSAPCSSFLLGLAPGPPFSRSSRLCLAASEASFQEKGYVGGAEGTGGRGLVLFPVLQLQQTIFNVN